MSSSPATVRHSAGDVRREVPNGLDAFALAVRNANAAGTPLQGIIYVIVDPAVEGSGPKLDTSTSGSGCGTAGINIDNSAISNNTTGVQSNSNIRISNSDVTFNTTGFSGTAVSYGNNRLQGNNSFGTAVGSAALQ